MAKRTTTRIEDMAYCMLGIFGINMALLYGEDTRAFLRLQEEIIKVSDDQTIFCWQDAKHFHPTRRVPHDWVSILAPHPAAFHNSSQFFPRSGDGIPSTRPYSITNRGLRITAPLLHTGAGAVSLPLPPFTSHCGRPCLCWLSLYMSMPDTFHRLKNTFRRNN